MAAPGFVVFEVDDLDEVVNADEPLMQSVMSTDSASPYLYNNDLFVQLRFDLEIKNKAALFTCLIRDNICREDTCSWAISSGVL